MKPLVTFMGSMTTISQNSLLLIGIINPAEPLF